jgi:MFS family permease
MSEFIETSPASRRKLLALGLVAVVLGAVWAFLLRPTLFAHIRQLPACDQAHWSVGLLIGALGLLPIAGLSAGIHARKLVKHDQFPPPDAWVWRRTPIRRGRGVRYRAYAIAFCSAALFAIFLYGWHVLWPIVAAISRRCTA